MNAKSRLQILPPGLMGLSGRFFLSFLALLFFILMFFTLRIWMTPLGVDERAGIQSSRATEFYLNNKASSDNIKVCWPVFPGSAARKIQEMVMDGVRVVSEDWKSTASSADILAYYQQQMLARGWQDVTEDTYGLRPDKRNQELGRNGLQDPNFITNYVALLNKYLILNRGSWTLHLAVVPNEENIYRTKVSILFAESPSILVFTRKMMSMVSAGGAGSQRGVGLVVGERIGRDDYHTKMTASKKSPDRTLESALESLKSEGWIPSLIFPDGNPPSGYFVWLERGRQYATLSVKADPQAYGSTMTFTEVTPN